MAKKMYLFFSERLTDSQLFLLFLTSQLENVVTT